MRLDDACSAIVDCEHKTAPVTLGGKYFAVGTPAMQGNAIDYSQAREISRDTFDIWTQRLMPEPGDLLFAREAPVGPIVRIPSSRNVAPGQRTVLLRPNSSITDSSYLYYRMISPAVQQRISEVSMGSTVAHLNVADIRSLDIDIPPLPEQQAIAEVLGALDDKIAANRKLITTIDELMMSLVENLTPDAVLSQLASLRRAPIQPAVMPPTVSHYSLPRFDESALPGHEANESIKSGKFSFDHPAVLLSKLNPRFPRIWNVPTPEPNAVASTEFLVLEPKSISTATLWALLSTARAREYLQEHVAGTTGSHQRFKPGDAMTMPMPSRISPELERTLTGLGDRAVAARYESQTLASLRDTLLPALMDGTIRVKDAETHVEEVL